jgi:hypothetical protein
MTEQVTSDAGSTHTDTGAGTEQVTVDSTVETGTASAPVESGGANENQDPAPVESQVPESYSFEAPEGAEVDQDLIAGLTPVLKEIGITQEQAAKLFGAYTETMGNRDDTASIAAAQQQWETDLKTDPEFGGDNFGKNAAAVSQFIQSTVPDGLKEGLFDMLRSTGVGSHPALVKYVHHLSKQFPTGEDTSSAGQSAQGGKKTAEQRMYGTD